MSFDRWAEEVRTALRTYGRTSEELRVAMVRVRVESGNTVVLHWRRKCSCCADENPRLALEQFSDANAARFEWSRQEMKPVHSVTLGTWLELGG